MIGPAALGIVLLVAAQAGGPAGPVAEPTFEALWSGSVAADAAGDAAEVERITDQLIANGWAPAPNRRTPPKEQT